MPRIFLAKSGTARIAPQPWMTERATRRLLRVLGKGDVAVRFVGGAVRDALLGRTVSDIDVATPAAPDTVMALLDRAGIKVVPTGLAHGTVTAVIPPRHFEITTLRHDVEPLGRHARVAFIDDWRVDAERRDFTMNALFLDPDGTILDYVGGLPDLRLRRVRFVGDPETRIREDVLRLLRFYRFHAQLGREPADPAARAACRLLAPLLPRLSAERVSAELLKLMKAPDPLATLALMAEDGVLQVVLPEATGTARLAGMLAIETGNDPIRRLAAVVVVDREGALALARRLKFSNVQRDRLAALVAPVRPVDLAADLRAQRRALYRLGPELYSDLVLMRAAEAAPTLRRRARALLKLAARTKPLVFPLKGRDLARLGLKRGPAVGRVLREVEAWWEAGDFRATRRACLNEAKARIAVGQASESRVPAPRASARS